jgi:hypothetical protein
MEVVMRKFKLLWVISCVFIFTQLYAQPVLQAPAKTVSTFLTTVKPTFQWLKASDATNGYEFYLTGNAVDTVSTTTPVATTVNKSKRYVSVGTGADDITFTLADTVLQKNTIYYWKVRSKTGSTTFGSWSKYFYFKTGMPNYLLSNGNAWVKFNHDTLGAITSMKYLQGSGKQLLDTAYNTTNLYGLGGNGAQKDTVISWYTSSNTDTSIFTYQSAIKYGKTGSKIMTVSRGTNGITADVVLKLEDGKTANITTAWTPGGNAAGNDNALFVKNSATKTQLTYPGTEISFGPDSMTLSAMYDQSYSEYFGIKSSSLIAVNTTQKTGLLKQVLSFSNSTGSNKTFTFSFAVRKTRADYFDTWADNRPMIISAPAAGDSLSSTSSKVIWESFGATPYSVAFSSDGGTTFGNPTILSGTDTSSIDTAQYTMPKGPTRNTCVVKLVTSEGDVAQSGVFKLVAPYADITFPKTGDSLTIGQHKIVWTNYIGAAFTNVAVSLDSEKTWSGVITLDPASTAINDSTVYSFFGAKETADYAAIKLYSASDTITSEFFKIEKRYATVTSPKTGDNLSTGSHYVVWNNYTGSAVKYVDLSSDSGKTWSGTITLNPTSTAVKDSVLYNFYGGKNASLYNIVRVRTDAAADTANSGIFGLGKGTTVFSIPTVFGDPAGTLYVPISATDYLAGDSIKSFDLKLTFDSTFVRFDSLIYNACLNNWITMMDSTNAKDTNYVRIAAFKNTTGVGVKNSEILRLKFTIKDKQNLIGQSTTFAIMNSVLAASGNGASSLDVSNSINGTFKVYSSISGSLHYLHEKWDGSPSNTISGDSLINYYDSTDAANNSLWPVVNGYFHLSSREPNDAINFYPSASKYMATGLDEITVDDAMLAFADWYDTLSVRAKIAADVNGDGIVNTTDAMAIMQISVDSTYLSSVGLSNWIFIDSTNLATFESASDSLTGWYAKQKHSISYTLTNQRTNQDFFGVLRGDVNFSYGHNAPVNTLKKTKSSNPAALFSTDAHFNVRPGDDVWIPLNIDPSKNAIGGFNASMQVNPKMLTYSGQFKTGPSIPQGKNWYIAVKSDANGKLKVAATDFSRAITPITQNGPALLFKYTVNKNVQLGTTGSIDIQTQSVVDTIMQKVTSQTSGAQLEVTRMGSAIVTSYALSQNYPNPFNPTTTIEFALPADSKVDIEIFNILGQKMATLFSGYQTAGYHQVVWNASKMSSGIYFSVMKATSNSNGAQFNMVKKLVLMK